MMAPQKYLAYPGVGKTQYTRPHPYQDPEKFVQLRKKSENGF